MPDDTTPPPNAGQMPEIFRLTPYNPAYREDPYPILAELRETCPVLRDEGWGSMIFTRYGDVRPVVSDLSMWRDPLKGDETVIQRQLGGQPLPEGPRSETTSILTLDDPDHARVRQPLAQALYARVAKFRPEVERIVGETLDAIDTSGPFDLMTSFCVPIPIDVIV